MLKGDFYTFKEIEKIATQQKKIVLQSVKDVLQSLVDDRLVRYSASRILDVLPNTAGHV